MEQDKNQLAGLCIGCKWNTIKSGKEYICNRPDMGATEVAEQVVNAFFGEVCKCYEPTTSREPQK